MPEPSADTVIVHEAHVLRGRLNRLAVLIVVLAGVWRVAIAVTIPCIARDSVNFCWYARDLGTDGLAHLREPTTHQHPLFPVLVLGAQRIARACGADDTPLTWQYSGQAVSWMAGMAVVVLAGALTLRVVRRLELPVSAPVATCCALLLAGLLPLNVWLSAEVMSDQLHLAFYLLGAWALLKFDGVKAAAVCGLAGGLAFLTRPEGMVVVLAGLVVLAADRGVRWPVRLGRGVTLVGVFLVCTLPYWVAVGKLSPKKNPLDWLRRGEAALWEPMALEGDVCAAGVGWQAAAGTETGRYGGRHLLLAKLELLHLKWYEQVPYALRALFRGGRVVVPLLAAFTLFSLRRRLLRVPLIGVSACVAGHFALTLVLLARHHYLQPRHMLVIILLLVPFAAVLLAWLLAQAEQRASRWLKALVVICVLPLAFYSLRQPNFGDRFLVEAAHWLSDCDPEVGARTLMSGSSHRRIAFYTGATWLYWYEAPDYITGLRDQILKQRPDYFVIETGRGFEREGNNRVVEELSGNPQLADHLVWMRTRANGEENALHIFRFDWGGE